jgi:hypothetical protein
MNPYLEQEALWQDFHIGFLNTLKERLVPQIRPRYVVLLERYIYVHEPPEKPAGRRLRADLLVAAPRMSSQAGATAVLETEAPTQVEHIDQEVERVAYLEVRDNNDGEIVSIVELLSLANKRDEQPQYLAKRGKVLASTAHLIEIDLLRGGRPMPDANRSDCAYSVLVSRAAHRPRAGFWPIGLKQRLPVIPIPLRDQDKDAHVDLQEILDHVYDASGYEDFVYRGMPEPALSAVDAEWARQFLPGAL